MSEELCQHGAVKKRHEKEKLDILFACPVVMCSCCETRFPYIDQATWTGGDADKEWSVTWEPKNRCSECGGKYVERGENPWRTVEGNLQS